MKKLLIVLAVLLLAAPTMAAEWNFYGSARFATFSVDADPDLPGVDSDRDTRWNQQGNSRIGATVKFNDEIGGGFEYSHSGGNVGVRKMYGTYNFGAGELLIGQDYTPSSSYFYSNSVYDSDGDLLGVGQFYVGRVPMIQLKFGNLKLAFIDPNTKGEVFTTESLVAYNSVTDTVGTFTGDGDTTIPKIEASYRFKGEMFFVDFFGGYQTYEVESGPQSYDVDSYVVGIGAGLNFGPVFFNAGFHMGENLGNYGAYNPTGLLDEAVVIDGGNLEDQEGMGYLGVLGFKANDMLTIEAGYGREESEIRDFEQDATQYYLNATINITKGFFIVPEIGMIEVSEDGVSAEPEIFYAGAKWQINF
jgi:hypothetical protein